jgi:uncharacterized protein RhaS with RHS repeats
MHVYTYDDNGNMDYDGANMYAYDPENRLTTVEKVPEPLGGRTGSHLDLGIIRMAMRTEAW